MTKTFDEICKNILGEVAIAPNIQKPNTAQPVAPNTGAQAATQNNLQQNSPTNNDEELLKMLQQKLQDEKFKQTLLQLLNPQQQQPNAVNQTK